MNRVDIALEGTPRPPWLDRVAPFVLAALEKLDKHDWDISLLLCDNGLIRSLNKQYRGVDEATDVLSFAQGEIRGGRYIAGDIAVSLDMVVENAKAFAVPPGEELRRLILHGILHLDGMDHRGPVGVHTEPPVSEPMLVLQERLLQDLDGPGIMEFRGP